MVLFFGLVFFRWPPPGKIFADALGGTILWTNPLASSRLEVTYKISKFYVLSFQLNSCFSNPRD